MLAAMGWFLISTGFVTGAVFGLLAQDERWLGGYASRSRRLARLGHIALIALGALIVGWPCTTAAQSNSIAVAIVSGCFLIGALTMGPVCFVTAWRWSCRVLFIVPSTALIIGALLACWESLP